MELTTSILILPLLALGMDLLWGDPQNFPHPVRLVGALATAYESRIRKSDLNLYLAGAIGMVLLAALGVLLAWVGSRLPLIGGLVALYLSYAGLALGALLYEGHKVVALLEANDIAGARHALSQLVSRETDDMDKQALGRALAETVSENLGDGLVAPFFYLAFLGPAGLWGYKVVSTLDSMWGYKTEQYRKFGWAAARADDVLAWLPSRLAGLGIVVVGRLWGRQSFSLRDVRIDAGKTASPNAGWPMAAAAWVMGAPVGGSAVYFGKMKDKPCLGPEAGEWDGPRLRELLRLVRFAGVGIAVSLWGVASLLCLTF